MIDHIFFRCARLLTTTILGIRTRRKLKTLFSKALSSSHGAISDHQSALLHASATAGCIMASPCGPSPIEDRQLSVFSWCQMTNYGRESHSAINDHQPAFFHSSAIAGYIIL